MLTLEVKNIRKDFTSGTRTTNAVRDVSFTVKEGEMVAIVENRVRVKARF